MTVKEGPGVTANMNKRDQESTLKEWDQHVQELLNSLRVPGPILGKDMEMRISNRRNDPGILYEADLKFFKKEHCTRAWKPERWLVFIGVLFMLMSIEIKVPLAWPVGMTVLAGYTGWRWFKMVNQAHEGTRQNAPHKHHTTGVPIPRYVAYDGKARIGDTERDQVLAELGIHFSAGRMKQDEYEIRMAHTLDSVTAEDLANALRELPELTREEQRTIRGTQ